MGELCAGEVYILVAMNPHRVLSLIFSKEILAIDVQSKITEKQYAGAIQEGQVMEMRYMSFVKIQSVNLKYIFGGQVLYSETNETGDSRAIPPEGNYRWISIGRDFTCGVESDLSVSCWGNDSIGQTVVPNQLRVLNTFGSLTDCAGVTDGSAYTDNCGNCVGGTTDLTPCSQDCAGIWGGEAYVDTCGNCVGGNTGNTACEGDSTESGNGGGDSGGGCFIWSIGF